MSRLDDIKNRTTPENFGDEDRNWLISECQALCGRVSELQALLVAIHVRKRVDVVVARHKELKRMNHSIESNLDQAITALAKGVEPQ